MFFWQVEYPSGYLQVKRKPQPGSANLGAHSQWAEGDIAGQINAMCNLRAERHLFPSCFHIHSQLRGLTWAHCRCNKGYYISLFAVYRLLWTHWASFWIWVLKAVNGHSMEQKQRCSSHWAERRMRGPWQGDRSQSEGRLTIIRGSIYWTLL